jgi:hypothetical protein
MCATKKGRALHLDNLFISPIGFENGPVCKAECEG